MDGDETNAACLFMLLVLFLGGGLYVLHITFAPCMQTLQTPLVMPKVTVKLSLLLEKVFKESNTKDCDFELVYKFQSTLHSL